MIRILLASLAFLPTAWADTPTAFATSYAQEAQGDYAAALSAIATVRGPEVDDAVLNLRRGWLLYLDGQYDASLRAYQIAVDAAPRSVEAHLGLTLPLMAQRRWQDVIAACDAVVELSPGETTARSRRAWALYNLGRFAESEEDYRALVIAWPTNVDLRAGLGWAQCRQGDTVRARLSFAQVLAISPDHASASEGLTACR